MFHAYILKSEASGKLYKGHTENLERRLREHNDKLLGRKRYTRKDPGPWLLVYSEPFDTRSEAMKREKWFKTGQGREWINSQLSI